MKTFIIVVLLLLILAAGGFYFLTRPRDPGLAMQSPNGKTATATSVSAAPFKGHSGAIRSLEFSPDGKILASSSDDETVRLWDTQTGENIQLLAVSGGPIPAVAFSPDSKWFAIGRYDSKTATTVFVHGFNGAKVQTSSRAFLDSTNLISTVTFSTDSSLLLASVGPTANLWEVSSGTLKAKLDAGPNSSSAISPDGATVITGSTNEKELKCWSTATSLLTRTFKGHEAGPMSIQYSKDGKMVASGGYDEKVILWDTATGSPLQKLSIPDGDTVSVLRFSPDGLLVYGALLHQILVWNIATGTVERTIPFDNPHALAVSGDGAWLAVGGDQGVIQRIPITR